MSKCEPVPKGSGLDAETRGCEMPIGMYLPVDWQVQRQTRAREEVVRILRMLLSSRVLCCSQALCCVLIPHQKYTRRGCVIAGCVGCPFLVASF